MLHNKNQFQDYFELEHSWLDDPSLDMNQFLQTQFPSYFINGKVDYHRIRAELQNPQENRESGGSKNKQNNSIASSLFKFLFRFQYKNITNSPLITNEVQQIAKEFGTRIIAHGIEEAKGGMYSILLMAISNRVQVSSMNWGPFVEGLPNISPLSHGPCYLIYEINANEQTHYPKDSRLSDMHSILVPFVENRDLLGNALSKMLAVNLIDDNTKISVLSKIKTYGEFLSDLKPNLNPKRKFSDMFFQPNEGPAPKDVEDCRLGPKSRNSE